VSGAFLLGLDAFLRLVLLAMHKKIPEVEITRGVAIFTLAATLVMQLVALAASWTYVTRLGKRPFWRTLGWRWHPQFKWVHAVALAMLMYGLGIFLSKVLPHKETDVEKILKLGALIRVMVAVLAVATAPLVEEVVYRGVVYTAVERISGRVTGVIAVAFIFALVHVPQYWGSVAALTAIVSLSLVLTLLRAWTGSLLPCVATHLVYNGIQAVILLVAPDKMPDAAPPKTAMMLLQWLGQWFGQ
jgi:membrane protease YdiL (CAAX protease family)